MNPRLAIVYARMDGLKAAIQHRNWETAEFQFDRVHRALTKLEEELKEEKDGK